MPESRLQRTRELYDRPDNTSMVNCADLAAIKKPVVWGWDREGIPMRIAEPREPSSDELWGV